MQRLACPCKLFSQTQNTDEDFKPWNYVCILLLEESFDRVVVRTTSDVCSLKACFVLNNVG